MSIRVKVLNPNTVEYPDGTIAETHSRPDHPAPEPDLCWHDVLCKWVPESVMTAPPFYAEIDGDAGGAEGGYPLAAYLG